MSRDFNKVIIMGRLARDPDVRFTPNKQKVARFSVATGRQWKNKQTGEAQSHTDFVSCTAWSFGADLAEKYLKKGSKLLVEGRISTRDYDDVKTGQHKWVTEVVVENIVLLGSKGDSQGDNGGRAKEYQDILDGKTPAGDAQSPDAASLRDEAGFEDEFPLDFSELDGEGKQGGEVKIPF